MSDIKKQTHILIDNLTDEQVEHIYNIMRSIKILSIPTVEPDEFDLSLIKEAEDDNKEYTLNKKIKSVFYNQFTSYLFLVILNI